MGWLSDIGGGFLGGAVGGLAGLIGYDMQRSAQNKRQDKANRFTANQAEIDRNLQEKFARQSLGWQIDQVREAGLSPLAVLGNNPSYSPLFATGSTGGRGTGGAVSSLQKMGQSVGDIIQGKLSRTEKRLLEINLLEAEEKLKQSKITTGTMQHEYNKLILSPNAPRINEVHLQDPSHPAVSHGGSRLIIEPKRQPVHSKTTPGTSPGAEPYYDWVMSPQGQYFAVPNKELAERIESDTSLWTQHMVKRLAEFTRGLLHGSPGYSPPISLLKKGHLFYYDKRGYFVQRRVKLRRSSSSRKMKKVPYRRFQYR